MTIWDGMIFLWGDWRWRFIDGVFTEIILFRVDCVSGRQLIDAVATEWVSICIVEWCRWWNGVVWRTIVIALVGWERVKWNLCGLVVDNICFSRSFHYVVWCNRCIYRRVRCLYCRVRNVMINIITIIYCVVWTIVVVWNNIVVDKVIVAVIVLYWWEKPPSERFLSSLGCIVAMVLSIFIKLLLGINIVQRCQSIHMCLRSVIFMKMRVCVFFEKLSTRFSQIFIILWWFVVEIQVCSAIAYFIAVDCGIGY